MGTRSIFALEASDAEIACECGGSVLRTEYDGRTTGYMSPAACAPKPIWQFARRTGCCRGATALACSQTKQFCCFIGPEGIVEKNLRELVILAEKEKQQQEEPEAFADNVIMYEILSELKDIAARPDGITCACGSNRWRAWSMPGLLPSGGPGDAGTAAPRLRIPAATDRDLDDLCCHMKLVIPGQIKNRHHFLPGMHTLREIPFYFVFPQKGMEQYDFTAGAAVDQPPGR